MTNISLLETGDEVTVTFTPKSRLHGEFPDGSVGIVASTPREVRYISRLQKELRPGAYSFRSKNGIQVWLPAGHVTSEWSTIEMVDKGKEWNRITNSCDENGSYVENGIRLGDLPETEFWELDKVTIISSRNWGKKTENVVITRINLYRNPAIVHNYSNLYAYSRQTDKSPKNVHGWTQEVDVEWGDVVVLAERGSLWKYYHGSDEQITLESIREELRAITMPPQRYNHGFSSADFYPKNGEEE